MTMPENVKNSKKKIPQFNLTPSMPDPIDTLILNTIIIAPILCEQQAGNENLTLELNPKFVAIGKATPMSHFDFVKVRQKAAHTCTK